MDIRRILLENWGIKLVSLFLAVFLWLFVTSKGKMEISLTVPVELQNIPAGTVVVGDVLRHIEVRLQGPERLMRDISAGKSVVCMLNLGATKPGDNLIRISPDDIRVPSGITVTHLTPYETRVKLEPLVRRTVKLRPVLHGRPAKGYRIAGIEVDPKRVSVEGPASVVRGLSALRTMPVDVTDASRDITLEPRIDTEGKPIKLLEKKVALRITVQR